MRKPLPLLLVLAVISILVPVSAFPQQLTGTLIGTVKDEQGGVLPGALVRINSRALIGGPLSVVTNERGQLRFQALPPGPYVVEVEIQGFAPYREEEIAIGAGATIERTVVLSLAGVAQAIVVEAPGSRIEARNSGFETRFGSDYLRAITGRRFSMFDDRPHILRGSGSLQVPRTGFMVAASAQHFSGKPWAASTQISLPQGDQRILLEPRGTRRLSSQTLLDLRLSRPISFGGLGRIELLLDVLNALNETAEEGLASDNVFSPNFGQPTVFVDPRRVMLGARLNLGR